METRSPDYRRSEPFSAGSEAQGLLNGTGAAATRQVNQSGEGSGHGPSEQSVSGSWLRRQLKDDVNLVFRVLRVTRWNHNSRT